MRIAFASLLRISLCAALGGWIFVHPSSSSCAEEWVYTMRAGENLWVLTERYCDSIARLREVQRLNRISDPYHVPPGTRVRFPLAWMKSTPGSVRVATLVGLVRITTRGVQSPATPNSVLHEGDLIETGSDANMTIEFDDGSRLTLLSESSLRLQKLLDYPNRLTAVGMQLPRGRTESEITNRDGSKSRFHIKTPAGITSVRGTQLRVGVMDATLSRTEVLTGTVTVVNAGREVSVEAGYGTIVRTGKPPQTPVALLAAPDLSALPELITRVSDPLQFEPVAGAVAYRVQLASSAQFDRILFDAQLSEPKLAPPALPNARYIMRVRAIDASGLEGRNGERTIEVAIRPEPPVTLEPVDAAVMTTATPTFRWASDSTDHSISYRLQISHDAAFLQVFADISDLHDHIILPQPLSAGQYYWRVGAVSADRGMGPFSVGHSLRVVLPAPTIEHVTVTPTHIRLHWDDHRSSQRYRVQLARDNGFEDMIEDRVILGSSLELPRPAPGRYYLRVRAIEPDGYEGLYPVPRAIELNPAPSTPEALHPSDDAVTEDGMVEFYWQPSNSAHGYRLQLARDFLFQALLIDTPLSEPRFEPERPLKPGVYFWRVAAESEIDGRGAFSAPRSVRRLVAAPSYLPPVVDAVTVSVRWQPQPGALQYEAEMARDEAFQYLIARARVTAPEWRSARPSGGQYFIHVRSVDADGVPGPYGRAQATEVRPRPAPPRLHAVSPGPAASLLLTWEPQENGARHRLQISTDTMFNKLVLDQRHIESPSFIVPATLPPALYHWRAAASTEADGEGEFSAPGTFRIPPGPPHLGSIAVEGNHLLFRWREQPASVQYQVEVANDTAFRTVVIDQRTNAVTLQVPRPSAGSYFARIRSIDAEGVPGPYSDTSRFQVPPRFPLWLLLPLLIIIL
jgi:hypothetical protein